MRAASCLETTEISVEIPRQWFGAETGPELLHEQRLELRDRLVTRLELEGSHDHARRLASCGEELMMACSQCGERRRVTNHCRKRWCPLCAPLLAVERVHKTRRAVLAMRWPLAITLTIRNVPHISRDVFAQLLRGFRRLRQRQLWKQCVRGGFAACELTNRGRGWHPHLHILADARWLSLTTDPPRSRDSRAAKKRIYRAAAAELEREWAQCIGQKSASVRTRRKFGRAGAIAMQCEAMKYAVKPDALIKCERGRITEVIEAMKGTRLFLGFGSCYRLKLDDAEKRPPRPCPCCGEAVPLLPESIYLAREENRRAYQRAKDRDQRRAEARRRDARIRQAEQLARESQLLARYRHALSEWAS